jgi:predicted dehydrogenase
MEKKIRYAVIGCGEHALRAHAVPALAIPEYELVALCDPSEHQSWNFQEALGLQGGVSRYRTLALLLGRDDIDAVVIASPDRFHAETLFHAVFAGKHVLCEKPLADNAHGLDTVRTTVARAGEKGLVVSSCHPRRLDPPFLWLRANLARLAEEHGPVVELDFDFSYHRPSGTKGGLHVGLLMDHLNHEFDLMNFLFGFSPVRAHRLVDGQLRYHVAGVRKDGIAFSFAGTRLLAATRYPEFVRVRFERAALDLACDTGEVRIAHHETGRVDTPRIAGIDYAGRFAAVMRNFADAILGTAPNYLAERDLLMNTEIGIALTSSQTWASYGA